VCSGCSCCEVTADRPSLRCGDEVWLTSIPGEITPCFPPGLAPARRLQSDFCLQTTGGGWYRGPLQSPSCAELPLSPGLAPARRLQSDFCLQTTGGGWYEVRSLELLCRSFGARGKTRRVLEPRDRGRAGWRAVLVALGGVALLLSDEFGAEGRLGLGDDSCKEGITL